MTQTVLTEDQKDLHAHIDQEADGQEAKRPTPWYIDLAGWIVASVSDLLDAMESLPRTFMYSVWSLIGTSIVMASIPRFVLPALAAEGMVLAFLICVPVSVIYWIRYDRGEQLKDEINARFDSIMEALAENDYAVNEKLDAVVRNAV